MDEGNGHRGQRGFPQNMGKNNCRLYTMGKLIENKGILSTSEEKDQNIPYLSTSYQQIVDKVKKRIVDLEEKKIDGKKKHRYNACVMRCILH